MAEALRTIKLSPMPTRLQQAIVGSTTDSNAFQVALMKNADNSNDLSPCVHKPSRIRMSQQTQIVRRLSLTLPDH